MTNKKRAKVYKTAAKLISSNYLNKNLSYPCEPSVFIVNEIRNKFKTKEPLGRLYDQLFAPHIDDVGGLWEEFYYSWFSDQKERNKIRITALCLAAAMAEAGDL